MPPSVRPRQKAGTAEELARRIKEGAIPIMQRCRGLHGLLRGLCARRQPSRRSPSSTISQGAEEANRRALAWSEQSLAPLLVGPVLAVRGPGDRPYHGVNDPVWFEELGR